MLGVDSIFVGCAPARPRAFHRPGDELPILPMEKKFRRRRENAKPAEIEIRAITGALAAAQVMIQRQSIAIKIGAQAKRKIDLISIAGGNVCADLLNRVMIGCFANTRLPIRKLKFTVAEKFPGIDYTPFAKEAEPQQGKGGGIFYAKIRIECRRGFVRNKSCRV
ncbi:MAG: hypothetical protein ALAOOOJD_00577 [bacterium]|nr:hypothetical protein [bacterium]